MGGLLLRLLWVFTLINLHFNEFCTRFELSFDVTQKYQTSSRQRFKWEFVSTLRKFLASWFKCFSFYVKKLG